jgi:polyhydroxybutyrate depolymerase
VDDVGFIRALIHKLQGDYRIDAKRVDVTGISNGGMMSYRLACELSDEIAAIATMEGAQDNPYSPTSPVSVIIFHGTADRLVPCNGGSTPFQLGSWRSDIPVKDTVAFWEKEDGCPMAPQKSELNEAQVVSYSGCRDGRR